MITAQELRIGNWIKEIKSGKPYQIEEIHYDDTWPYHEPIPLTPEILEKAGFGEDIGETKTWKWEDYNFYITKDGFVYTDSWYKQNFIPMKSLHQLQNLYFALTGEELEINL